MVLHKNANFWTRFATNLIDIIIFIGSVFLQYYFLIVAKGNLKINFYIFLIFSNLTALILFLVLPSFLEGRTLGMVINHVQFIHINKKEKLVIWKLILFKAIFNFWLWLLISIIFVGLIKPTELENFKDATNEEINNNYRFIIAKRIVSALSSLLFLFTLINYLMVIGKKNKIGLLDIISKTRIVYLKHYKKEELSEMIKLIPFKNNNQEFKYFNN